MAGVRVLQDRRADATKMLTELLRQQPDDARLHGSLADELLQLNKTDEALQHYRTALKLSGSVSPGNGSAMWANNLAWVLSTNPDAKVRNGAEAVEWARKACDSVDNKQPVMLDTLACALAENGQFDEAIRISKLAIELAATNATLVKTAQQRIRLFEASQPYHEK
jgi:Flp pilus assembly protein TadD